MGENSRKAFWKRRSVAFLFFVTGILGLFAAMSVSIQSVRIKRNVTLLNREIVAQESREKELEEEMIGLTNESKLRGYARANHLERALPAEVLYLP